MGIKILIETAIWMDNPHKNGTKARAIKFTIPLTLLTKHSKQCGWGKLKNCCVPYKLFIFSEKMSEILCFSLLAGKSIPVHCVVEVLVPEDGPHPRRSRAVVETDSYAIIPVSTPFEELVHVALYRLGYPQDCAHLATGMFHLFLILLEPYLFY